MPLVLLLWALSQAPPSCPDVAACRADAEAAAARGDYETFHDLAWRAVQKGKPNDPALMFLLARAQSLSGRPDDAVVMLGRLADLHGPIDLSLHDFDRARQRPGWAALAERVAAATTRVAPASTGSTPSAPPPPDTAPHTADVASSKSAASAPVPAPAVPAASTPGDVTTFEPPPNLRAFAIGHDTVSRRFVVGDAPSGRLLVVDEVSRHVVPYVSAASAGFYDELTALTIDARRGDLWVASTRGNGGAATSIVHKLQLVSGRGLMEVRPEESLGPVRIVDLAVTADGTVYALDAAGGRVLRLRAGGRAFEIAVRVDAPALAAIAVADDHTLYLASGRGLLRVDAASRVVQPVKSLEDLGGFSSLSWHNGALYAVQHVAGASLAIRLVLEGGGTRARPRAILASSSDPMVATVSDGAFYYLVVDAFHRLPAR